MNEKKYQKLFVSLMDELFDNTNQKTLEYYCYNGFENIPPKEFGLYTIIKPNNFNIEIMSEPETPKLYESKPINYNQHNSVLKLKQSDNKYLYIGKSKDIRERIGQYINFGFTKCYDVYIKHKGGCQIWLIKNNEKLILSYITIKELKNLYYEKYRFLFEMYSDFSGGEDIAEFFESCFLDLHTLAYNNLPFANYKPGKNRSLDFWKHF